MRTARSRTFGAKLFVVMLFVDPSSQKLANTGGFVRIRHVPKTDFGVKRTFKRLLRNGVNWVGSVRLLSGGRLR